MARVKRGVTARARHKKTLTAAKGYYNARRKVYRVAKQAVTKAQQYAYIGRKQRKRQFRALWIVRINAAARQFGLSYSRMIAGLATAGIAVDRKVLADLAVHDIAAFGAIAGHAKAALGDEPAPVAAAQPKAATVPATSSSKDDRKDDDLTMVAGVGPKIAEVLNEAGIHSFAALAKAQVEKLGEILHEAGSQFASHDPETWPKQAGMAAAGKFEELKRFQDSLVGGRKEDDLTMVDGVGPKIAEVLNEAGIHSFDALAKTEVDKLSEILHEAGSQFASHDPETWPKQATLAAAGKFEELKKLQEDLVGGRKEDDLTMVEGVGPKIAEVLNEAGIHSFDALAKTEVDKLSEILHEAGSQFASHDPETWPKQAALAAAGKFEELKKLQEDLVGGRPA